MKSQGEHQQELVLHLSKVHEIWTIITGFWI